MIAHPFESWANFYVIVGSSAGALTGLQFVVMALIADARRSDTSDDAINAFGTPTVLYFCDALLISAILSAPWPNLRYPAIALVVSGAAGVGYGIIVLRRAMLQKTYTPVFEDWLWFTALPLAANASVVAGAGMLTTRTTGGLFAIAAGSLLLLFVGIHNSWDTVTFIVTTSAARAKGSAAPAE
jgi:hypothetical protein